MAIVNPRSIWLKMNPRLTYYHLPCNQLHSQAWMRPMRLPKQHKSYLSLPAINSLMRLLTLSTTKFKTSSYHMFLPWWKKLNLRHQKEKKRNKSTAFLRSGKQIRSLQRNTNASPMIKEVWINNSQSGNQALIELDLTIHSRHLKKW